MECIAVVPVGCCSGAGTASPETPLLERAVASAQQRLGNSFSSLKLGEGF